jgi:hypothetical protein
MHHPIHRQPIENLALFERFLPQTAPESCAIEFRNDSPHLEWCRVRFLKIAQPGLNFV